MHANTSWFGLPETRLFVYVQRAIPPTSADEYRQASIFPSGSHVPRVGDLVLAPELHKHGCGTAYSRRLSAVLHSSLCAGVGALGLPSVRLAQSLSGLGGEALLAVSLRAALRSLTSTCEIHLRVPLIASAKTCLAVFAASAMLAAAEQLAALSHGCKLLSTARDLESSARAMHTHLQSFACEVRRLPSALTLWAQTLLNEESASSELSRDVIADTVADVSSFATRAARDAERYAEGVATL